MEKSIHQGRNVKRLREMLGIKQESLALELGENWNQRKISLLEQKEQIEPEVLELISNVLKLPVEAILNFDSDTAMNVVSASFVNQTSLPCPSSFNFNPIDKIIELYEALLKAEREKIDLLERMLDQQSKKYITVSNKELLEEHLFSFHDTSPQYHGLCKFN